MSIVLSHTTAKAVYQAVHSVSAKGIESCNPAAIYGSCPTGTLLDAAAEWLTKHDVSLDANDSLEVMVFDRRIALRDGLSMPRFFKTILELTLCRA